MLVTLPFLGNLVPVPFFVSLILILFLAILAGITNPAQRWINFVNTVAAAAGFIGFEYYAIDAYKLDKGLFYFAVNQILAIIFFIALYYSTKTLRGKLQGNKD